VSSIICRKTLVKGDADLIVSRLFYGKSRLNGKLNLIKRVANKITQIKQSSKIQQAASYQAPNSQTLIKSDKKRIAEDDDVIVDEEKTTVL
jgi:hypothetical protein